MKEVRKMSELIDLIWCKDNVFVWSAEDWLKLRKNYRIIGELLGCLPKRPRQDVQLGLPLLLLPEEVSLLIEKQIARVIQYPCMQKIPSDALKKAFETYRDILFTQQEKCLRDERKKQILMMMDKIVEGKKRKILGIETSKKKAKKSLNEKTQQALNNIEIDTQKLLNEEMAKLPKLEKSEALVQTHTIYPWKDKSDVQVVDWKYPSTSQEELRYKTFKDLWEKGYYVTSGEKFGGDFLTYPGDPIMFHSQFIIQCKDKNEEMSITDLVAKCRIGCHVRKTEVFATFSENSMDVKYQSFQWAENNLLEDR